MFKIGDTVKCIRGSWYEDTEGLIGTIITKHPRYGCGVDYGFDDRGYPKNDLFHKLDGAIKTSTGYWIQERDLKKVKLKKSNKDLYRKDI